MSFELPKMIPEITNLSVEHSTKYYSNGQKKYEGSYVSYHPVFNHTSWYENGNKKSEGYKYGFEVDTIVPDTVIINTPDAGTKASTASFEFIANEANVIYHCSLDSVELSECISPKPYVSLSNGEHTFSVKAVDRAGNEDNTPAIFTWLVDSVAPATPILIPMSPDIINDSTPNLTWNTVTEASNYTLEIDSITSFNSTNKRRFTNATIASQEVVPALTDGTWYFRVKAIDATGNESAFSTIFDFEVDTEPEGVPVTIKFATPTNDTTPTFTWELVTGAVNYRIMVAKDELFQNDVVDTSEPTGISYTVPIAMSERIYYWKVASIDIAGNLSAYSLPKQFEIDSSLPDTPIVVQVASPTNDNTLTITWNAVTDKEYYRIQIDDNSAFVSPLVDDSTSTSETYTTSALNDGRWYYRMATIDSASNQSGFSVYKEFVVDTSAPAAPSLIAFSPDPTNDKTPLLEWTQGSGTPVEWEIQIDNSVGFDSLLLTQTGLTETEYQVTSSLPTGTIYWRVRQKDEASNEGNWTSSSFVTNDAATIAMKFDFTNVTNYLIREIVSLAFRGKDIVISGDNYDETKISAYKNMTWVNEYSNNTINIYSHQGFFSQDGSVFVSLYGQSPYRMFIWNENNWNPVAHPDNVPVPYGSEGSVVRDENDKIHLVYNSYLFGANLDLGYLTYDAGILEYTAVDSIDATGYSAKITLFNSLPEIVYYDSTENKVRYAKFDGSNWDIFDTGIGTNDTIYDFFVSNSNRYVWYSNKIYSWVNDTTWILDKTISMGGEEETKERQFSLNSDYVVSCSGSDNGSIKIIRGTEVNVYTFHTNNTSTCKTIKLNSFNNPVLGMYYSSYSESYLVSSYPISFIDTTSTSIGLHTSLVMASSKPQISYYDAINEKLKFATYNGETWSAEDIDINSEVGLYTSLNLYSDDDPGVSYYDANLGNLKYAYNNDGGGWTIETVDNSTNVGQYSSLQIDSTDKPRIAYYDIDGGNLKYTTYTGATWNKESVDTSGDVGQYSSLKLKPTTEYPAIAYYDATNGSLKYAEYNGSTWNIVAQYAFLELRADGDPVILYYDATNGDLLIAEKDSSSWTLSTVSTTGDVGKYCSLAIDTSNNLHVSFYDETNTNLVYGYSDNTQWGFKVADGANVEDGNMVGESVYDFTGNVGKWSSIQLRQDNGAPSISYYDVTEGALKYVEGVVIY